MADATVTTKGQVTIPAEIRDALGIAAQDKLTFTLMPDGTVTMRAKNKSLSQARGLLQPTTGVQVTVEQMGLGDA